MAKSRCFRLAEKGVWLISRFRFPSYNQFNEPINPAVVAKAPPIIKSVNADWKGIAFGFPSCGLVEMLVAFVGCWEGSATPTGATGVSRSNQ